MGQQCPKDLGFAGAVEGTGESHGEPQPCLFLLELHLPRSDCKYTLFVCLRRKDGKSKHTCVLPNLQQPPSDFIYDSFFQFLSPEVPSLPTLFQHPCDVSL